MLNLSIKFIFLPLIINVNYNESVYRALTFLVISCPCALVISVPLCYFSSIGIASKRGILVKGSNYIESLNSVKNIVFQDNITIIKANTPIIILFFFTFLYSSLL